MKYYIQRGEQEYGPYSVEDLRRYVADGNIAMNDMARPEDGSAVTPVSQVLSPPAPAPPSAPMMIPAPETAKPVQAQPQWTPPQPASFQPAAQASPRPGSGPMPPDLHWVLVLLIGFFCGLFSIVWMFIQANFVKKIDPNSKAILLFIAGFALMFVGIVISVIAGAAEEETLIVFALVPMLGYVVCLYAAIFNMRSSLVNYYNNVEPYGLRLSGVMTFFFSLLYFQYHLSRIAQWKRTGVKPL